MCFVEAVIGSRKVRDQHSICHGEKNQGQVFKCFSRSVSGWKGICDGIQDIQDIQDSPSHLRMLILKIYAWMSQANG
jgi:hypothetical protein